MNAPNLLRSLLQTARKETTELRFGRQNIRKPLPTKTFCIGGFIVLEDNTLFSYKCDNLYCPKADRGMRFDDPALGIVWPGVGVSLTLSQKDQGHPFLSDIEPWEEAK